jgi:hypothetical protein
LLINGYLAVGTCSFRTSTETTQILDLVAAPQVIEDIIHKVKHIIDRIAHAHTFVAREIDDLGV